MKEPVRPTLTRRERQIMEILYRHGRSEEHTSELQSLAYLVCRLLLGKEEHTSELQSLAYLVCRLLLEKEQHRSKLQTISYLGCCLPPAMSYLYETTITSTWLAVAERP